MTDERTLDWLSAKYSRGSDTAVTEDLADLSLEEIEALFG
jgi:hypothetical protein